VARVAPGHGYYLGIRTGYRLPATDHDRYGYACICNVQHVCTVNTKTCAGGNATHFPSYTFLPTVAIIEEHALRYIASPIIE
jgi:hypothetical protein